MYHSLIGKPCLRVGLVMGLLIGLSVLSLAACGGENSAKGGGGGEVANKPQQEPAEEKQAQQPAGKGQQQRKQEPEPHPAPEPPRPGHQPITLAGTQSTMQTRSFQLESGLAVCKMTHQGQYNIIVTLLLLEDLDKQGRRVAYGLADEFGNTSVSNAVSIAPTGRYILEVEADGPWEVTIEQPRPSSAPQKTSFSGSDNDVTPLFERSSGLKRVSMTHEGYGHFFVELLDKEGRDVAWALGDEYGPAKISSTVTIPQDDIYLFMVEADGPWTIDVE
jgi:hypothetical protein